jgi:hypothetical protein
MLKIPVFLLCLGLLSVAAFCVYKGGQATDETQKKLWMKRCFIFAGAAGVIFWFFGFETPDVA